MTKNRLDVYVARSVTGNPMHTVVGIAAIARSRNSFSGVAAPHGARLIRRGCVRDVGTSGDGPPACDAANGLCTTSGTKTTAADLHEGEWLLARRQPQPKEGLHV